MIKLLDGQLYQYDLNKKVEIMKNTNGTFFEIKMSNGGQNAFSIPFEVEGNKAVVEIPNFMLKSFGVLTVATLEIDEDGQQYEQHANFNVKMTEKPEGYVYTDNITPEDLKQSGGGGGVSSWNDLTDKPFYDESKDYGSTITWDGNTEGLLEVVMVNEGPAKAGFYLVASDVAIVGDITVTEEIVSSVGNQTITETLSKDGNVIIDSSGKLVIALEDNATVYTDGDATFTFPKKGVWFVRADVPGLSEYTSSVTLHNGSFIDSKLKKLDPKFIPNTKTIFYTKHDDEFLYTDSECTVMAVRDDVINAFEKGEIFVKDDPKLYRMIYMEDAGEYLAEDQSACVKVTIAKQRDSELIPSHFYTEEYFGTPV